MPECQKIKNGGLDQYGPEHFEMSPFDTTGLESVKVYILTERTWAACNIVQCSEVIAGCRPTQHDTAAAVNYCR